MTTADQPSRHHHAPAFYLKPWCDAAGMLTVWRRGSTGLISFKRVPRKVGFERHLWALRAPPDGDRQRVERDYFGPLDGSASLVAVKLLGGVSMLSNKERFVWATFVSSLHLRVPEHVHRLRRDVPKMLIDLLSSQDDDFDRMKGNHPAKTPWEYVAMEQPHLIEDAGVYIIPQILAEGDSVQTIVEMEWAVRSLPPTAPPLLTSDAPMIQTAPLQHSDCIIVLPLSPNRVFFATRRGETHLRLQETGDRELSLRVNEAVALSARSVVIGKCEPSFLEPLTGRLQPSRA